MITDGMSALNEMFDRMRERGHLFLALVDTDPNSAMQLLAEDGREVLSLPGDDQLELMEIFRAIFVKVEETTTQDELISALSGVGDTIRPWVWTAEEWNSNPNVERLLAPLDQDGPYLISPDKSTNDEVALLHGRESWRVRAVERFAAEQWRIVSSKLPEAAQPIFDRFTAGEGEITDPKQSLLCGRLGQVIVGNRNWEHWQIRNDSAIRHGKRTKKDPSEYVTVRIGNASFLYEPRSKIWIYSPVDESRTAIPKASINDRTTRAEA